MVEMTIDFNRMNEANKLFDRLFGVGVKEVTPQAIQKWKDFFNVK